MADPGNDRRVAGGAKVTLDATRSRSDRGAVVGFAWRLVSGPTLALADETTARPSFVAPAIAEEELELVFELTVRDEQGRSATAAHLVTVELPDEPESSAAGKVFQAMQQGVLDRDTAVQYLAFATFGDERLPPEYRGEPSPCGTWAMDIVVDEFATLSEKAKEVVRPFLLPAHSPESWLGLREAQGGGTGGGPAANFVDGTHVRVWYSSWLVSGRAQATLLRDIIDDKVWPDLEALMGKPPMSDFDAQGKPVEGEKGGDGKLDVTLVHEIPPDSEGRHPAGTCTRFLEKCPSPSHLVIASAPKAQMEAVAAHEVMHAIQNSFEQSESATKAKWLREATATWAIDFLYPTHNYEHGFAEDYLERMDLPLEAAHGKREYGIYLLFQFLTWRSAHADRIRRVWEQHVKLDAYESLDTMFEDGTRLKDHWDRFLVAAWNRGDEGMFKKLDGLTQGAEPQEPSVPSNGLLPLPSRLDRATGVYHLLDLPSATSVVYVYDGLDHLLEKRTIEDERPWDDLLPSVPQNRQAGTVSILLRPDEDGRWVPPPTFAGTGSTVLCRALASEKVDELVVISGNGMVRRGHRIAAQGLPTTVLTSDIHCGGWKGTSSQDWDWSENGAQESFSMTAHLAWGRVPPDFGQLQGVGPYRVEAAEASFTMTGSDKNAKCTWSGSHQWSFVPTMSESNRPRSGLWIRHEALPDGRGESGGYRDYSGFASPVAPSQVPIKRICQTADGPVETIVMHDVNWWSMSDSLPPSKVPSGGKSLVGDAKPDRPYDWSFSAE